MAVRLATMVLAVGLTAFSGLRSESVAAQDFSINAVEARVWLDRGAEPVLGKGERARVYYRVTESAFVSIFHIDTNGAVRMIFPSSPQERHYARGGRDYRVLFPESSYWYVQDDPGIGYFFIVASPEPFDFRDFGYSHFAGGWDLSQVGMQVYGDPYLAMDDYVEALIPEWEYVGYGLDFSTYHVEHRHEYPRFLCYDCHAFQPYYSWNPYAFSCTSFRVVIYSDPYYYPATRYRGTRVVYVEPRRGVAHYEFKERVTGEAGTPHVVVRNTPPTDRPGVEGGEARRAVPRSGARSTPQTPAQNLPSTTRGGVSTQKPVLQRRPGGSGSRTTGTTGPPATRPSSRVTVPRSGGGTPRGSVTRSAPTVRSGGSTSRGSPTVRSGGSTTRPSPTVRSGGSTTRPSPTVRSGGTTSRSIPKIRSGGSAGQSKPTVRSGGGATRSPPRTTKPPPRKVKPRGGGGGG